jgi:hypothetical protein
MKFSIRDLLLVTVIVALAVGWHWGLPTGGIKCRPKESAYVPLLDP